MYGDGRIVEAPIGVEAKGSVSISALMASIFADNQRWWVCPDGKPIERNVGEMLMLVVSEVAEAMEGHRKSLMDDKLPHRPMFEVELADTIIRILDIAAHKCPDIENAILEKLEYNRHREDHKWEARLAAGGKKY